MFKKIYLADHKLTQTGRKKYSKNTNIVVFSCINFELTSVKQTALNKQVFNHKNAL